MMMKKWSLLILGLLLLLTACSSPTKNNQEMVFLNITAEEARKLMDSEKDRIILDVRSREEYDQGHIPGAILIPDTEIEAKAADLLPDKDQLILVYCRSGRRSNWRRKAWLTWGIPISGSSAASWTGPMKWYRTTEMHPPA